MEMTYDELSIFGKLRKLEKRDPFSMFSKLVHEWSSELRPTQVFFLIIFYLLFIAYQLYKFKFNITINNIQFITQYFYFFCDVLYFYCVFFTFFIVFFICFIFIVVF